MWELPLINCGGLGGDSMTALMDGLLVSKLRAYRQQLRGTTFARVFAGLLVLQLPLLARIGCKHSLRYPVLGHSHHQQ